MEIIVKLMYQLVLGFISTVGFAVYFYVPFDSVIAAGVSGGLSWVVYYSVVQTYNNKVIGTFLGAFIVGVLGEYLAIKMKKPATVFITPGIVPFVPGAGMYYTMLYLSQKNYAQVAITGSETFFMAAAIAIGIIVSTIFSKSLKHFKRKNI